MTDPVDDLLSEAGRRWRAGQPDPPEPDLHRWTAARPPSRLPSRRWMPAVAAVATGVVAGAAFLLVDRPTGTPVAVPSDHPDAAAAAELVAWDGTEVEATGTVVAQPGEPVRFCAPAPVAFGGPDGTNVGCDYFVPVTGVELMSLSDLRQRGDVRSGTAQLRGVWRSGELVVTQQSPALTATPEVGLSDGTLPPSCPRPAGGWRTGDPMGAGAGRESLFHYVHEEHPEQFRQPRVTYPDGMTEVDGTPVPRRGVEVLVIEVVRGDVDEARRELQGRYAGNLCVVGAPGRPSMADQARISATVGEAVGRLMEDKANGIYVSGQEDIVRPEMVILTPQLYDKLAKIGFSHLRPDPWLRPARR